MQYKLGIKRKSEWEERYERSLIPIMQPNTFNAKSNPDFDLQGILRGIAGGRRLNQTYACKMYSGFLVHKACNRVCRTYVNSNKTMLSVSQSKKG